MTHPTPDGTAGLLERLDAAWHAGGPVDRSLLADVQSEIRRLRELEAKVPNIKKALAEASEERFLFLKDCESEADHWKAEGDMYGWNFHMGMAGGANWADLFYGRVMRSIEAALVAVAAAGAGEEGKT